MRRRQLSRWLILRLNTPPLTSKRGINLSAWSGSIWVRDYNISCEFLSMHVYFMSNPCKPIVKYQTMQHMLSLAHTAPSWWWMMITCRRIMSVCRNTIGRRFATTRKPEQLTRGFTCKLMTTTRNSPAGICSWRRATLAITTTKVHHFSITSVKRRAWDRGKL